MATPKISLTAEPLTAEAFEPFGDVLSAPKTGRRDFGQGLSNARAGATLRLVLSRVPPPLELPLRVTELERHEFSSQSFLPISAARWLVIVAPPLSSGGPDGSSLRAFLAGPQQGVTYRMGTWHHAHIALDRPAEFAVILWRDNTSADLETVPLASPRIVLIADS